MKGSHVSLFAGVGMIDLAAEAAGFETVASAEVDPFCRSVLQKRFPNSDHYGDVREMQAFGVERPLLLSGGFPCQGISASGSAKGLDDHRSGLWSEFSRLIGEFRPEFVLIENSPMLRTRGMEVVLSDLVRVGYSAKWDGITAQSVGAPHLRDRIFIIARSDGSPELPEFPAKFGRAGFIRDGKIIEAKSKYPVKRKKSLGLLPTPRHANNEWRTTRNAPTHGNGHGKTLAGELNDRERAAGMTPAPSSDNCGNINPEFVEWFMGLPCSYTDPTVDNNDLGVHSGWGNWPPLPYTAANVPNRKGRLMALGNGCVPQAAAQALSWLSYPKE